MKIVKKSQRQEFKHDESCVIYEYSMGDNAIDGCIAKINGRYPEKGWALNESSKEMAYMIAGAGKITVENQEFALGEGDAALIQPNEKFFWFGNLELFIICTPAWHSGQYKLTN
jgi:mannose-6-phosphate isomerase-like protein (cupin superfamily)